MSSSHAPFVESQLTVEHPEHCREFVLQPRGSTPPFGRATHLRVFIDPDVLQHDEVWAAAGT